MSLTIVKNNNEPFTRSKCTCEFCKETHSVVDVMWSKYKPRNKLQSCMLKVIKDLEHRFANDLNKHTGNKPE
jgi:hypothetical protein